MKKRIVVLPGTEWQLPLVKRIKELGMEVVTIDPNPNSACSQISDSHLIADIFDDEKIDRLLDEKHIDGVLSDECDIAMNVIARIAKRYGLYSLSTQNAKLFTNKYLMREFCKKMGINSPEYKLCRNVDEAVNFFHDIGRSIVIKPIDSNASHGVFIINSESDLREHFSESIAFSHAEKAVLAERYIQGTEFTVDGIKTLNSHYTLAISQKKHYRHNSNIANELFFSHFNEEFDYEKLKSINDSFVINSGLLFGFTHAEYKYENGSFYFIEIGARGGGNLISGIITQYMSGYDTYKYLVTSSLFGAREERFDIRDEYKKRVAVLKFFDTLDFGGVIKNITGIDYLESEPAVKKYHFNYRVGDKFEKPKSDSARIGYYIACAENKEQLRYVMKKIADLVKIEFESC